MPILCTVVDTLSQDKFPLFKEHIRKVWLAKYLNGGNWSGILLANEKYYSGQTQFDAEPLALIMSLSCLDSLEELKTNSSNTLEYLRDKGISPKTHKGHTFYRRFISTSGSNMMWGNLIDYRESGYILTEIQRGITELQPWEQFLLKLNIAEFEPTGERTEEGYCAIEQAWERYAKRVQFSLNTLANTHWTSQTSHLPIEFSVAQLPPADRGLHFGGTQHSYDPRSYETGSEPPTNDLRHGSDNRSEYRRFR